MTENKEEIQVQVSQLIHQNIVNIATDFSKEDKLDIKLIITFVQDINLLSIYDVKYIHNDELNEIIDILSEKSQNSILSSSNALIVCFDYLLGKQSNFKQAIIVNLFLKVSRDIFIDSFNIFNVLASSVKELYGYFIKYIFNEKFLTLDTNIQIDILYKAWVFSQQLFHDNEASQYAYNELKELFYLAIKQDKEEVVFWLYYTPLHYFHSATQSDLQNANIKLKEEIEDPLEEYITKIIVPKYSIKPNLVKAKKENKIKVAFVMQRIVKHSTVFVLFDLLKDLIKNENREYEFILYDLNFPENGGSNQGYVNEFKALGIEYIDLHKKIFGNMSPLYSLVEKCIKTREILIEDEIDILVGLHTRVEYMFLYVTRTAAKQYYWFHNSNHAYDVKGIDKRITHSGQPPKSKYNMETFTIYSDYSKMESKSFDKLSLDIKSNFTNDMVILGSIGRLIKVDSESYINVVVEIMKENPNTIYLACGIGDKSNILKIIEDNKLENRFFFPGFIDTRLYCRVIDIYLDTFPEMGGESVNEFASLADKSIITLDYEVIDEKSRLENYIRRTNIAISNSFLSLEKKQGIIDNITNKYSLSKKVVLGIVGNLDKVLKKQFIEHLAYLMNKYNDVVFLFVGEGNISLIKDMFAKHKVEDRIYFENHININALSNIINIYMDTSNLVNGSNILEFLKRGILRISFNHSNLIYNDLFDMAYSFIKYNKKEHEYKKDEQIIYFGNIKDYNSLEKEYTDLIESNMVLHPNIVYVYSHDKIDDKIVNRLQKIGIWERFIKINFKTFREYISFLDIYVYFDMFLEFQLCTIDWFKNTSIIGLFEPEDICTKIVTNIDSFSLKDYYKYASGITPETLNLRSNFNKKVKQMYKDDILLLDKEKKTTVDKYFNLISSQTKVKDNDTFLENENEIIKLCFNISEILNIPEYIKSNSNIDFFNKRFNVLVTNRKAREYISMHFCMFNGYIYKKKYKTIDLTKLLER